MLVSQIFDDFRRHHTEHSAPATVTYYAQGLRWLLAEFGDCDWEALDRIALKDALHRSYHRPDGSPMAPATHRRNKVAFAQVQKHAIDQGFTDRVVLTEKDLKKPGCGRREAVPTGDDLDRLIAAASPATSLAFRALRASGMRPGELCRADVTMIEGKGKTRAIVLREHKTARKTGKARKIALGKELAAIVDQAAGDRSEGPIWLDDHGQRWTPSALSGRFRRGRDSLGLAKGLTLYTIRHYVGTWATRKAGIHAAKELLGHTSITMTQRYAHGDETDQLAAQEALEQSETDRKAA
jgi:integrase